MSVGYCHVSALPNLELKIPPDLVALVVAALMWLTSAVTPGLSYPLLVRIVVAGVLAVAGAGLIIDARMMLARARTTWQPGTPGRTAALVTGGVYRFSRNPIYLGMLLILVGWATALMSPVALGVSALFVPYMDRFQIGPEERVLSALLGQSYRDYLSAVRRWL
jgi:protein-S-isoprenylcysteine O-methyltransferase Ste14